MALDKLLGQIVDIARQIKRASAPPPPLEPAATLAPAPEPPCAPLDARPPEDDEAPVPVDDQVLVTRAGDGALLVSWQLSPAGIARAERLAPSAPARPKPDASVEARLYIVVPDRALGSKTLVRERAVGRAGEWLAADLPQGALVNAAVGVSADGRFVSVAHSGTTAMA